MPLSVTILGTLSIARVADIGVSVLYDGYGGQDPLPSALANPEVFQNEQSRVGGKKAELNQDFPLNVTANSPA